MTAQEATEELSFHMTFNQSITFAMVKTTQGLSDFVFVNMANTTFARRDRTGIISSLVSSMTLGLPSGMHPLVLASVFSDSAFHKAEDEIADMKTLFWYISQKAQSVSP